MVNEFIINDIKVKSINIKVFKSCHL